MQRPFFFVFGILLLGLGAIGAVLPVMPTTIFVLGAAACFARSSDRLYHWLTDSRTFGPIIRNWEATRSMPRRAKVIAISMIVIAGGTSVVMMETLRASVFVAVILLIPITTILLLPTTEKVTGDSLPDE